jgi:hypothetical protein
MVVFSSEMFTACEVLQQIFTERTSLYFLNHRKKYLKKLETFRPLFKSDPHENSSFTL